MELATECGIPTARSESATEEKPAAAGLETAANRSSQPVT